MTDFPERVYPGGSNFVFCQHLGRYEFVRPMVAGKRILDAACGSGYGTECLSNGAPAVVLGVDLSREALEFANGQQRNAHAAYIQANCLNMPFPDGSFDVIVCFEFIEHILEQQEFLLEVNRLLSVGGRLVISTPNASDVTSGNPYHLRELSLSDFQQLLRRAFPGQRVAMYGQQFREGLWVGLIRYLDVLKLRRFLRPYAQRAPQVTGSRFSHDEESSWSLDDLVIRHHWLSKSLTFVAVIDKIV